MGIRVAVQETLCYGSAVLGGSHPPSGNEEQNLFSVIENRGCSSDPERPTLHPNLEDYL